MRVLCEYISKLPEKLPDMFLHVTEQDGNLLHLAVQYSAVCLREIIPYVVREINHKDINGIMAFVRFCKVNNVRMLSPGILTIFRCLGL